MVSMLVTDILKMYMKKFNAKKIFFDKFTEFNLHIVGGGGGYTVSLACSQFLVLI